MIAELHPTHEIETTPAFYAALKAHNASACVSDVRAGLRVVPDLPQIPRCRPTERRLRILNDGTGVSGAVLWNA